MPACSCVRHCPYVNGIELWIESMLTVPAGAERNHDSIVPVRARIEPIAPASAPAERRTFAGESPCHLGFGVAAGRRRARAAVTTRSWRGPVAGARRDR